MASRRALPSIAQATSATWRAGHATVALRRQLCICATPALPRGARRQAVPLVPLPSILPKKVAVRHYSQDSQSSKILSFKEVQEIASAGKAKSGPKIVLVDTREPAELQSTGRIPTAINIPITTQPDSFHITDEEFENKFGFARPDRDTKLVMYCRAGVRCRAAATLAREAGWEDVEEYSGSWLDWEKNGGEVER